MATNAGSGTLPPQAGALYDRWRAEPPYRLLNLAGDPDAWRALPLDSLELLLFDQCLVFGAAYPGPLYALDHVARRDRVVRVARDRLRTAHACFAARAPEARRVALTYEVAHAVALRLGSPASLLPFARWDIDDRVRAAAEAALAVALA